MLTGPTAYVTKAKGVEHWLRSEIIAGRLEPGRPVLQDELAERLGVSSTPVREAFVVLEAEGFLERRPHHGVIVANREPEKVADAYEIRMVLEAHAARQVAAQRDPRAIAELDAALREARAALHANDETLFRSTNNRFHMLLVRASGSAMLAEVMQRLVPRSQLYGPGDPAWMSRNHAEHEKILKALRTGDADRAEKLLLQLNRVWSGQARV